MPTIALSRTDIDARILVLHDLRSGVLASARFGREGITYVREPERPQRTGKGPTHVGPVTVCFKGPGGYKSRPYAFHSDIPVAVGDTVDVETIHGVQEGVVYAFGSGAFYGPLKPVVAVKAVRS